MVFVSYGTKFGCSFYYWGSELHVVYGVYNAMYRILEQMTEVVYLI